MPWASAVVNIFKEMDYYGKVPSLAYLIIVFWDSGPLNWYGFHLEVCGSDKLRKSPYLEFERVDGWKTEMIGESGSVPDISTSSEIKAESRWAPGGAPEGIAVNGSDPKRVEHIAGWENARDLHVFLVIRFAIINNFYF